MMYMLTPMDLHPDKGFGVLANEFYEVGKKIQYDKKSLQHLPVEFILRHSIELFLKSTILLLTVSVDKTKKQDEIIDTFSKEHNLKDLFSRVNDIVTKNNIYFKSKLPSIGEYPKDFEKDLYFISDYDNKSTFFRYPMSGDKEKDKKKDHSKTTTMTKVEQKMKHQKIMTSVIVNSKNEIVNMFEVGNKCDDSIIIKMKNICEYFSTLHIALRMELFNGY